MPAAKPRRRRPSTAPLCRAAGLLAIAIVACGCVGEGHPAPDSRIVTGSIHGSTAVLQSSTENEAVRQAVASAGAGGVGPAGIAWADPETGTVGVITALDQVSTGAGACRNFETSRHGYNGIALYVGRACRSAGRPWRLIEFRPKHASATLAGDALAAAPAG